MIPLYDDNPTKRSPVVTVGVIAACVAVFLYQLTMGPQAYNYFVHWFGVIPGMVTGAVSSYIPQYESPIPASLTLVTSLFLHGGILHLAGNMLFLWIFGNNIEDALGPVRFIAFYVLAGVAAALAHILQAPASEVPMIGASGAVSGVLGAYLLLYPKAQVGVLVPLGFILTVVRLPAVVVLLIWFGFQFLSNAFNGGAEGGGVAYMAHIAGFFAGMALSLIFKPTGIPFFGDGRR
ncbi:rhomboid family intramembrane serine protease [Thiohalorhabdus sp.]|uniref:rhomboid family intramembrane serine protease n=1 Tax=Thiohalorhabdus sp. TaxID=3094134 RepID=UPI002FC39465